MIKILLGIKKQHELIIDDEASWLLTKYRWYWKSNGYAIYARTFIDGKQVFLHRLLMNPPPGMQIDHINHNGLDNRRCNLRIVSPSQNARNTRSISKTKTSKYKGVSKTKNGRWRAVLAPIGNYISLGCWTTEEEAARAYDAKARELFGEYAVLNFE